MLKYSTVQQAYAAGFNAGLEKTALSPHMATILAGGGLGVGTGLVSKALGGEGDLTSGAVAGGTLAALASFNPKVTRYVGDLMGKSTKQIDKVRASAADLIAPPRRSIFDIQI